MKITETTITGGMHATKLRPGKYAAETACVVTLFHGRGDSRREVEYRSVKPGEEFEVRPTTNGHWYGFESVSFPCEDDVVLRAT